MTMHFPARDSVSEKNRSTALNLLLFLTGILLGALLVRHFDLFAEVFPGVQNHEDLKRFLNRDFPQIFLSGGKFLLMIYLLGFQRWGAMMVPPVFGIEGLYFGGTMSGMISVMGLRGMILAILLMLFRLLLVLPYGFLLGGWAVNQSLGFSGDSPGNRIAVLLITLLVMTLSAFLECTLGRWLGGMYYLTFGV